MFRGRCFEGKFTGTIQEDRKLWMCANWLAHCCGAFALTRLLLEHHRVEAVHLAGGAQARGRALMCVCVCVCE